MKTKGAKVLTTLACLLILAACKDAVDLIVNESGTDVTIVVTTASGETLERNLPSGGQFAFSSRRGPLWRISKAIVTTTDRRVIGEYSNVQYQTETNIKPSRLKIIIHADHLEIK
ncbi:MAG: hypothetical protein H7X97_04740 [Opitutaceae bacterium]|nr:hypothetical protein [Verrucomicrobiales bacterium]